MTSGEGYAAGARIRHNPHSLPHKDRVTVGAVPGVVPGFQALCVGGVLLGVGGGGVHAHPPVPEDEKRRQAGGDKDIGGEAERREIAPHEDADVHERDDRQTEREADVDVPRTGFDVDWAGQFAREGGRYRLRFTGAGERAAAIRAGMGRCVFHADDLGYSVMD